VSSCRASAEEKPPGELRISLTNALGQQLSEFSHPVEVMARNEWGGYGYHPSLLVAFCLLNQKSVKIAGLLTGVVLVVDTVDKVDT